MIDLDDNQDKEDPMNELEKATVKMKKGSDDLFKNLSQGFGVLFEQMNDYAQKLKEAQQTHLNRLWELNFYNI